MATDNQALLLQVSADLSKLEKAFTRAQGIVNTGSDFMERRAKKLAQEVERNTSLAGEGFGKSFQRVFDSARLATLEEGSSRLRIFGSALEPLGPLGIGVAAALAAVGIAAEEAHKAMEWADNLDRTATKLGLTTQALQELDFASASLSIGVDKGREAFESFNGLIGKFETHTGDVRIKKWADAIGLTRKEVNETVDPVEKLTLVMERISKLSDAQSRTAAAKAFGLDGLLPVINKGSAAIEEFIAKMRQAQGLGAVINDEDIRKAAELNEKVESLNYLIGQHLKEAFLSLAPVIESTASLIEKIVHSLAGFMAEIPDALRGVGSLAEKFLHLDIKLPNLTESVRELLGPLAIEFDLMKGIFDRLASIGHVARLHDQMKDIAAGKIDPGLSRYLPQGPGVQLTPDKTPKGRKGPEDDTLQKRDAVDAQLAQSGHDLLEAQKALTGDIKRRAEIETQAIDEDLAKKTANIQKQIDTLAADKGIKDPAEKARLTAELALAQIEEEQAAQAKKTLIDRQAGYAIAAIQIEVGNAIIASQEAELSAQAATVTTAQARTKIERRILLLRQQHERDLLETDLRKRLAPGGDLAGDLSGEADKLRRAQRVTQAAETQQFDVSHQGPIKKYLESIQDLDTEFQNAGVTAAHDMASGLADAIANAKSLGDVAKQVFRKMVADLLAAALERDVTAPLLHAGAALFGFADGGRISGAGGPRSDSNIVAVSDGEYIVSAAATAKHLPVLEAINSGRIARFASGGLVGPISSLRSVQPLKAASRGNGDVLLNVNVIAGGAIPREEIEKMVRSGSLQAVQKARELTRSDFAQASYHQQLNQ